MAKAAKVAPEKVEKPSKPKIDPEIIVAMKAELRPALAELDPKKLDAVAKRFGINVADYAKLGPGLKRMNVTNSILGSAARWMRDDGKSKKDVFQLLK